MTNILFFSQLLRDDSSSVADTESEISEIDLEQRSRERLATSGPVFMAIGKVYHAITRSVHLGASSSAVKIETSTSDVAKEVLNQDDQSEERKRSNTLLNYQRPRNFPNHVDAELVAVGWPSWLAATCGEAIMGWIPRRDDTFEKLDKIGQGKHSDVYKARDLLTQKLVAIKKIRIDSLEPKTVKFIAREILILRRLDHPNVMKLEGLVTSRMSCSLYLVFEYMEHDLAGLAANSEIKFTEPQIKCYMYQLLVGLEHCHNRGVLHRDIKGSDLLLDNEGVLKIADFGLASFFDPRYKQPMTSRVVSLWYRPPELLLGGTDYGVGVDLWSAGCVLAELLAGRPILPGRNEVEQLHKIFKLCGSPSEEYLEKSKLPHARILKPQQSYKSCIAVRLKDLPPSSLSLIETLLAIDPSDRQTATAALTSEFFSTKPYRCEPSYLPQYPPSRSMDAEVHAKVAKRPSTIGIINATAAPRGREARLREARLREAIKAIPAPITNFSDMNPYGCQPPSLAQNPHSITMKAEESKRRSAAIEKAFDVHRRQTRRGQVIKVVPIPTSNIVPQADCEVLHETDPIRSSSEKFPSPHQNGPFTSDIPNQLLAHKERPRLAYSGGPLLPLQHLSYSKDTEKTGPTSIFSARLMDKVAIGYPNHMKIEISAIRTFPVSKVIPQNLLPPQKSQKFELSD